jgi:hypothetical protein
MASPCLAAVPTLLCSLPSAALCSVSDAKGRKYAMTLELLEVRGCVGQQLLLPALVFRTSVYT